MIAIPIELVLVVVGVAAMVRGHWLIGAALFIAGAVTEWKRNSCKIESQRD